MTEITNLPLDHVLEVSNYRETYPQDHIKGLADSMRQSGFKPEFAITVVAVELGNLRTKAVETYWVVNTGHCRRRAAILAGLATIPAIVKSGDDLVALRLDQLSENENRLQVNELERAKGYAAALSAGASMEQLAKATGKHTDYITRRVRLLDLVTEAQELVRSGQLPIMYAMELWRLTDSNFQRLALSRYRDMRSPNLDDFRLIIDDLVTKMSQATLFDLPLYSGRPVAMVLAELKAERPPSREEQLEAEVKRLQAERAHILKCADREIKRLRAELAKAQRKAA